MSWLTKISALPSNWWNNAQFHLDNAIKNMLQAIPKNVGLNYEGDNPVYIPNTHNKNIVGFYGFSRNEIAFQVSLWAKEKRYDCLLTMQFKNYIADYLKYNEKSKSKIYHTDIVDGLQNATGELIGAECKVRKNIYDRTNPLNVQVNAKEVGSTDLVSQEITPYNIINSFIEIISNDFDNDNENFNLPEFPKPPEYSVNPSLTPVGVLK